MVQHPDHSLADNAMYWLGECHYSSGQYAKAVTVFKKLVSLSKGRKGTGCAAEKAQEKLKEFE